MGSKAFDARRLRYLAVRNALRKSIGKRRPPKTKAGRKRRPWSRTGPSSAKAAPRRSWNSTNSRFLARYGEE